MTFPCPCPPSSFAPGPIHRQSVFSLKSPNGQSGHLGSTSSCSPPWLRFWPSLLSDRSISTSPRQATTTPAPAGMATQLPTCFHPCPLSHPLFTQQQRVVSLNYKWIMSLPCLMPFHRGILLKIKPTTYQAACDPARSLSQIPSPAHSLDSLNQAFKWVFLYMEHSCCFHQSPFLCLVSYYPLDPSLTPRYFRWVF